MRLLLLPFACLCLLLACRRDEPVAGGRPLSHWVDEARQWSAMPWWSSTKDERRAAAFRHLQEIGEPAIPALLDLLRDPNAPVSGDALNTLAAMGPRARSAVPELQRMLDGPDPRLRAPAAMILGAIGPDAAPAVPALTEVLRDADLRVAHTAADALARIGDAGWIALDRAAQAPDAAVRRSALAGLAAARPDRATSREHLALALDDPSPEVRAQSLALLHGRDVGAMAGSADLLVRAMHDSSEVVREAARRAYTATAQRGTSTGVLVAVLAAGGADSRADAAWRLGSMLRRPGDRATLTPDDLARSRAALTDALGDADPTVRIYAARGLASGANARARLVSTLRAAIPEAPVAVGVRGAAVLWELTERLEGVQPAFEAGLASPDRWVRLEVLSEIGRLGPAAAPFAPAVDRLRGGTDREIRERAERVLGAMAGRPTFGP